MPMSVNCLSWVICTWMNAKRNLACCTSTESCVLYINGAYWGVYEYREKVDDIDYTDYYFDQPEGFVDFIKTWGGTWVEYGSQADWITLRNFITGNDMTDPANYDYVLTQYNHMSDPVQSYELD